MPKVDLKQLSEPFGMKTEAFANAMGYSRQALHAALKTGDVNHRRMYAALKSMKTLSDKMYLKQINEANIAKSRREQVLASLAKWFRMSWD